MKEREEMVGEIGFQIKNIRVSDITHPYNEYRKVISTELTLVDEHNDLLHICGDNDWGYLALEILKPIIAEAEHLINDVKTRIARIGDKPEAILLGKNQQRIMDIYCGGEGKCYEIAGIPIARSNESKAFKYIGNVHDKGVYEESIKCSF